MNAPKLAMSLAVIACLAVPAVAAVPSPAQKAIVDKHASDAKAANAAFTAFSAERGRAFFQGTHKGGKADTPSCTSCHTPDLTKSGKTRAGKDIAPMAVSVNPKRLTDPAEVDKWFKRNCNDVLGRDCTAEEKGDVLVYLLSL